MKLIKRLLSGAMVVFMVNCAIDIPVKYPNAKFPVFYSNLPIESKAKFHISTAITFHYNSQVYGKTVQEYLENEFEKVPGAKGIKNLKVRISSSTWRSFQYLNIVGYMVAIYGTLFGYSFRVLTIDGEVY
ncbi:MAG: hypothetical protein IT569_05845 [Leptospiraceae bacterium]|nr:hypothetical protein [Leptospiraceae bacterium]